MAEYNRPNVARMYDYMLGGHHNFAADRNAVEQLKTLGIDVTAIAYSNRSFLRRAAGYFAEQGIRQFLDIGAGLPIRGAVHGVVQSMIPDALIVYVDVDPEALALSELIVKDSHLHNVHVLEGDLLQPLMLVQRARSLIDFTQPVGVLMVAVLHFVLEDRAAHRAVSTLTRVLAPGSYIAISHGTDEFVTPQAAQASAAVYAATETPARARRRHEIEQFFHELALAPPGLVLAPLWQPDNQNDPYLQQPERSCMYVGVGKKL